GESAKANALAGLEIANNKKWGVHFLQGKLLNVRDATVQQVAQNEEVQALMKVFGLEQGRTYDSLSNLEYRSLLIMADQNLGGSH
ncbi:1451_t:CDS:1, partial [Entrophospora sp. SA101]